MTDTKKTYAKTDAGKLITYAWPGGYPVYYIMGDGGSLCAGCANAEDQVYLDVDGPPDDIDDPQWEVVAQEANWEDENLCCDHCNKKIESAYGPESE